MTTAQIATAREHIAAIGPSAFKRLIQTAQTYPSGMQADVLFTLLETEAKAVRI